MILKDNFKQYRHFALILLGAMVISLYGFAIIEPGGKPSLVKTADDLPVQLVKKTPPVKQLVSKKKRHLKTENSFETIKVAASSIDDLANIFTRCDYDVDKVRKGYCPVPRLMLTKLPQDITKIKDNETRKNTFILSLLPMVLHANERVLKKRTKLLDLEEKPYLSSEDRVWLEKLATHYNLKEVDFDELKKRVDVVPPSLFLAQAIIETGWGTSRAALSKRSLFGITLKSGVKSYSSLQESVDAYIHNLNYNYAYKEMRALRYQMRRNNKDLCSHQLIGKLLKYCEKRMWYVQKVRSTITENGLKQFDKSKLEQYAT